MLRQSNSIAVLSLLALFSSCSLQPDPLEVLKQNDNWVKQFGTSDNDGANSVAVDPSGNVYVTGSTYGALPGQKSSGDRDAFVRKYDSSGVELSTQQFGTNKGDEANSVTTDSSGNIYIAGITYGTLPSQESLSKSDAFIRKYDPSGKEIWAKQFGTNEEAGAVSITTDPSGNVYVAGTTNGTLPGQTSSGGQDAFVRKYDSKGNQLWTQQFGTNGVDVANSATTDSKGNVYVTGLTDGAFPGQKLLGVNDVYIKKYDSEGEEIWIKQFGTDGMDTAKSIAIDSSGNIYVAGETYGISALPKQTSFGRSDAFVRKYDSNGVELLTKQFGTSGNDEAASLMTDPNGNTYVAGWINGTLPGQTNFGGYDAFLYKISP